MDNRATSDYCILCGALLVDFELMNCKGYCTDCLEETENEKEKKRIGCDIDHAPTHQ